MRDPVQFLERSLVAFQAGHFPRDLCREWERILLAVRNENASLDKLIWVNGHARRKSEPYRRREILAKVREVFPASLTPKRVSELLSENWELLSENWHDPNIAFTYRVLFIVLRRAGVSIPGQVTLYRDLLAIYNESSDS